MRGFLQRIIDRRLRQVTVATTLGVAIVATTAVASGRWSEPKFDEADLAVEKAQILLTATECEEASYSAAVSCKRFVRRAETLLTQARRALSAAATVVDGGDVVLPSASPDPR
jgi:hypothetical protein